MDSSIERVILLIHDGSAEERGKLIETYRPFVLRVVSHICKCKIGWSDDEASVGLIAFNEAIDRYDTSHGKTFDNFAFMIIRNRLIDEFRRNGKQLKTESIIWSDDDDLELSSAAFSSSMEAYEREQAAMELAQELSRYDEMLQEYGVRLEELEECSPSHLDARIHMIQLAKKLNEYPELRAHLLRTKQLPIKAMLNLATVSKKTLERNRKYLIALILIFTYEDFGRIRSTVSFSGMGE
ncbi:RNA polymerase subunit sigma-28 [Cohnella kolymensis]|uniref:RNA polymerase sigma factor SigI n=1 Tax=Cohnella kolymensis TaxID=1590652 RepID=A0ABR5A3Z4_9BACL|nr:RNA polymerase sigma-I factor [Cohnella kolymensis]KIL35662.1 RNA polymerase subunit sigma-28 [Cohnella kolymensis]